jgi:hypothetical protein
MASIRRTAMPASTTIDMAQAIGVTNPMSAPVARPTVGGEARDRGLDGRGRARLDADEVGSDVAGALAGLDRDPGMRPVRSPDR